MDMRQLRYFKVLAEECHFGRAAQRLSIVQPALSRQIQQMEQELGVALLRRSQRHVEVLPAGQVLLERATHLLEAFERTLDDTRRTGRGVMGKLRLGFINSSTYGILPAVVRSFREQYPDIELELGEMPVTSQHEALLRGEIDIGILREQKAPPALQVVPILEDPFMLALPLGHDRVNARKLALKSVRNEDFVMFGEGYSALLRERSMALCEAAGFTPRVVQQATQIHTVIGLVGAGLGIALVPQVARNLHNRDVCFVALADRHEPLRVALAWHSARDSPIIQSFRRVTEQVIARKRSGQQRFE